MDKIYNRLANLISVKSLVTLVLTGVFAYLSCAGQINQNFMTIYAVIIAFYFGTQSQKNTEVIDDLQNVINGGQTYARIKEVKEAEG